MNKIKEYGGYMPLELSMGEEYYKGNHVAALNKGRSAILLAIQHGHFSKVHLPLYMCPSVADFIQRETSIPIEYYNIGEDFLPANAHVKENECILWANYFGLTSAEHIQSMISGYGDQLIIDNTQGFYLEPQGDSYFVYSCRKFFGVPDGAYLIKSGLSIPNLEAASSSHNANYLLEVYEKGTNGSYQESLVNEDKIEDEVLLAMSPLTHRILQSVDYMTVREKRSNNYKVLHSLLSAHNELVHLPTTGDSPMIYPLLVSNDDLRAELVSRHIYIPQWWKIILDHKKADSFEKKLSKYLLPLPIDQRYSAQDMQDIASIVLSILE